MKNQLGSISFSDSIEYSKLEKELSNNAKKIGDRVRLILNKDRTQNYNVVKTKLKRIIREEWAYNWQKGLQDSLEDKKLEIQFSRKEDREEIERGLRQTSRASDRETAADADDEEKDFKEGKFYKYYLNRRADILADRFIQFDRKAIQDLSKKDPEFQGRSQLIRKYLSPIASKDLTSKEKAELNKIANKIKNKKDYKKTTEKDLNRITRTEVSAAYNLSTLEGFLRSGVQYVQWQNAVENIRDGIVCPICQERNGLIVTIERAMTDPELIIPSHPNCACFWKKTDKEPKSKINKFKNQISAFTVSAAGLAGGYLYQAFNETRQLFRKVVKPDKAFLAARAIRGDETALQVLTEEVKEEAQKLIDLSQKSRRPEIEAEARRYISILQAERRDLESRFIDNPARRNRERTRIDAEILKFRAILKDISREDLETELLNNSLQSQIARIKDLIRRPFSIPEYDISSTRLPVLKPKDRTQALGLIKALNRDISFNAGLPNVTSLNLKTIEKVEVDLEAYSRNYSAQNYVPALQSLDEAIETLEGQNTKLQLLYNASNARLLTYEQKVNDYILRREINVSDAGLLEAVIKNTQPGKVINARARTALNSLTVNRQKLQNLKTIRTNLVEEIRGGNAEAIFRNDQRTRLVGISREINRVRPKRGATDPFDFVNRVLDRVKVGKFVDRQRLDNALVEVEDILSLLEPDIGTLKPLIRFDDYYRLKQILNAYRNIYVKARRSRFKKVDLDYALANFDDILQDSRLNIRSKEELKIILESIKNRDIEIEKTIEQIDVALYKINALKQNTPTYQTLTSRNLLIPSRGVIRRERAIKDRFIDERDRNRGITKAEAIKRRRSEIALIKTEIKRGITGKEEGENLIKNLEVQIENIEGGFFNLNYENLIEFSGHNYVREQRENRTSLEHGKVRRGLLYYSRDDDKTPI